MTTLWVPMTRWQEKIYNWAVSRHASHFTGQYKKSGIYNWLVNLSKVTSHPFQLTHPVRDLTLMNPHRTKFSGKFELLERMIFKLLRFRHKVVIFVRFKSTLYQIESFCRVRNIRFSYIDETQTYQETAEHQRYFVQGRGQVLIVTTSCDPRGWCMQNADTMILFECDVNQVIELDILQHACKYPPLRPLHILRFVTRSRSAACRGRATGWWGLLQPRRLNTMAHTLRASRVQKRDRVSSANCKARPGSYP